MFFWKKAEGEGGAKLSFIIILLFGVNILIDIFVLIEIIILILTIYIIDRISSIILYFQPSALIMF